MSLSKIYRGAEADNLQQFQFRSFGDPEPDSALPADFETGAPVNVGSPVKSPAPPTLSVAKQLEEAYAKGRQEGLASAEQRFETTVQALTQALEDVSRVRDSLAQSGSRDMLRLVMAVSEQVIRTSVAADSAVVLAIIENALQASIRADSYRIRINPADLEGVTKQKPLFLASISGLKNLSFEADPSIDQGGCRVDSELGDVDATIETQLESIRQALSAAITES